MNQPPIIEIPSKSRIELNILTGEYELITPLPEAALEIVLDQIEQSHALEDQLETGEEPS